MSFARNFAMGQQIARGLLDTYDSARERRDISAIMDATPTTGSGYTGADGQMLENVATARDADGNLAYQLDPRQDGSYGLRMRSADGSYTPVEGAGFRPQQYTDFLGRRTPGAMTDDQLDRARMLAVADVRTRRDPISGLQMRRAAKQDAREDTRFGWEEQAQPMKQRAAELQLSGAERTERQGLRSDDVQAIEDAVAKMPREALEAYASQLKQGDSPFPVLYVGATDGGYQFVTTDPATGKPAGKTFTMNESQLRQMAAASVLGLAGYGQEALARIEAVDKGVAEHIKSWNDAVSKTVTSQNDARHKGHTARMQEGQLGVSWFNARTSRMNAETNATRTKPAPGGREAGLWEKAKEVAGEGHYGGSAEKAYEGLKRGSVRNQVAEDARKLELDLRKNGMPEDQIQGQLSSYLAGQGLPSSQAVLALRSGKRKDGSPLTQEDYDTWDATFYNLPVADVFGGREVPAPAKPEKPQTPQAQGGLPPRMSGGRPRTELQQAYDDWQRAKGSWFSQRGPRAQQLEKEAEARYLRLLRDPANH